MLSLLSAGKHRARAKCCSRRRSIAAGLIVGTLSVALSGGAGPAAAQSSLRLHGSNTIGAELAPALLSAWAEANGGKLGVWKGAQEERTAPTAGGRSLPAQIDLRSHGSNTAVAGLQSGAADIGTMSRRISDKEVEELRSFGAMQSHNAEAVVALDGLAIIVHPRNTVDSLTPSQIAAIFTGRIRDWSEVGGAPGPISLFSRDTKSGTYDTFKSLILGNEKLSTTTMLESSEVLSDRVSTAPGAIGFIGLAYVGNAKALRINECGQLYAPSTFAVKSEEYPLFRRLYMYRRPGGANPFVEPFISYVASDAAQPHVQGAGFVNQRIEVGGSEVGTLRRSAPVEGSLLDEERAAVQRMHDLSYGLSRLSATIRFEKGKADFDPRAIEDMKRIVAFMRQPENSGRMLHVIGFASETGPRSLNLRLSKERADNVANLLKREEIRIGTSFGVGENLFVACNEPEERGFKNQRVEVWMTPR